MCMWHAYAWVYIRVCVCACVCVFSKLLHLLVIFACAVINIQLLRYCTLPIHDLSFCFSIVLFKVMVTNFQLVDLVPNAELVSVT